MNVVSTNHLPDGCQCEELDNSSGVEIYWVESDCPLHGSPTKQTQYGELRNGDFEYLINPQGMKVEDRREKNNAHAES